MEFSECHCLCQAGKKEKGSQKKRRKGERVRKRRENEKRQKTVVKVW